MSKKTLPFFVIILLTLLFSSCTCVYFNAFHNIRKNFNTAEQSRRKDGRDKARGSETKQYNDAITKASLVLERHPTSSWVDDALYIIGTSYYYLGEYSKSARKFKELYVNYPESEYIAPSRVIYAKAKLELNEEAEAVVIFEEIFEKEKSKRIKADAARSLGLYYFEANNFKTANMYFQALIDSLGDESDKLYAYTVAGGGFFELYQFDKALEQYEQALKHTPDTLQMYQISFRMAECDYFMNNIADGLEKLNVLAENELYYDSLAALRLMIAQGHEWEGDRDAAIEMYEKIIEESPRTDQAAIAYYELGLIYQYDLEELRQARIYYSKAREEKRNSPIYEDATKRSSTLSLLEQYSRDDGEEITADSTGKINQQEIDRVSENQFRLGELFYFDLEKPDSARHAFAAMVDKYPTSIYAPQALISLAHIYRYDYNDSLAADSLLQKVLLDYPHDDKVENAIELLGWQGTARDTGYAKLTFVRAENFLEQFIELDSSQYYLRLAADFGYDAVISARGENYFSQLNLIDSAQYYYQFAADSFPQSEYGLQAKYLLLYIYDKYTTPGDSVLIIKYEAFIDSFPETEYARAISAEYDIRPSLRRPKSDVPGLREEPQAQSPEEDLSSIEDASDTSSSSSGTESRFITDDAGNILEPANEYYIRTDAAFEYPLEAVAYSVEDKLYFQIRIDFLGEVAEVVLMNPTQSEELNTLIVETVKNSKFDQGRIPPEWYDSWFYYTYTVTMPSEYRQ